MKDIHLQGIVDPLFSGKRLDQVAAKLFEDYSRSRLQTWIREGRIRVDGATRKPRDKVYAGERIELAARLQTQGVCQAEDIPLDIVFADEHILVINKPAGLVVHPAAGNWSGTLQNGLLHYDEALAKLPRAGIVHRLDKDTTGIMVVARSLVAHKRLVDALQARRIQREYRAVVTGTPLTGGTIEAPIGRHPTQRTRMAVVDSGKPAVTHFQIGERFRIHSLLHIQLESGRTHQIRVHMAYQRMPVVGDPVYAGRPKLPPAAGEELKQLLQKFPRQALHACRLTLIHPVYDQTMSWTAPLPEDMELLLQSLREDMARNG